jgi:hypothetical protein
LKKPNINMSSFQDAPEIQIKVEDEEFGMESIEQLPGHEVHPDIDVDIPNGLAQTQTAESDIDEEEEALMEATERRARPVNIVSVFIARPVEPEINSPATVQPRRGHASALRLIVIMFPLENLILALLTVALVSVLGQYTLN